VRGYSAFSTQLDCNVLAIDYTGLAIPPVARARRALCATPELSWDYVAGNIERLATERGENVKAEDMIILVGQSMGTGVASLLEGQLAQNGESSPQST
jgi:abhydrolase domain-containing protein 12